MLDRMVSPKCCIAATVACVAMFSGGTNVLMRACGNAAASAPVLFARSAARSASDIVGHAL